MATQQQTAFERALSVVSPTAAHRRMAARLRYEAAVATRFRDYPGIVGGSESTREGYDRTTLIANARDLEQNFAPFRHLLDLFSTYAFPQIKYQARTGNPLLDDEIEAEICRWSRACDVSGELSLLEFAQLALRSRKRDGDFGVGIVEQADEIRLWPVEGDRIGNPYQTGSSEEYVAGVSVDPQTGQPLKYNVFYRTRGQAYVDPVEVPADNFRLLIWRTRTDQVRGRSDFASFLNTARDYKEVMDALRQGVKFECLHSGVLTLERPDMDPTAQFASGNLTGQTVGGANVEGMQPGRLLRLGAGEKADFLQNNRPSTAFQGYMQTLLEEMASGANVPPGFFWPSLFAKGPGIRMEAQLALRTFQAEQQRMQAQLLEPVKNRVIAKAILSGRLAAPLMPGAIDPYRGHWSYGRWVTIDAGRDSRAMLEEYRAGLLPLQRIADEQGDDWLDIMRQAVEVKTTARDLSEKYGVQILDQTLLTPSGQVPSEVQQTEAGMATAQLAAAESYKPPQAAADNAKRALEVRETKPQSERGMTETGIARARDLSNRRPLSEATVRQMVAWFARHEVDKQGETWSEQGKGWQAWHGWGGDEGRIWAESIVERLDREG
jgi:capsid protein